MSIDRAPMGPREIESDALAAEEPLVPLGNPLRVRALPLVLLPAGLAIFVMATPVSPRWVVPIAIVAVMLVTIGVLDFMGSFDDPVTARGHHCGAAELAAPLALALAGLGAQFVILRAAVAGVVPVWGSAIAMPVAFIAMVAGGYLVGERLGPLRLDEHGEARPLWRRHGFWLVVIITVVYLPMLGNHGLSDPWETHYGEVAREILARNDWISLWWAQEGWFFSKPVLAFWMQAAAMALTGVRYEPGAMLAAVAEGRNPQPEWPLRMTVFVLTVAGVYLLYKGVARAWGRRAAFLGALVLVTMPQFFLVAHQTMTDMPFVACIAAAVGLFLWGVATDPEERARVWEVHAGAVVLRLSLFHLVMGAVLLVTLPQILYLVSRNLNIAPGAMHLQGDTFSSGSVGNCGLEGNEVCRHGLAPLSSSLQPSVQALIWAQMLALFFWMSWGERRRQRLLFLAAWLCAALATMAKGPAGLLLPAAAAFCYVAATGRWRELTRMEIVAGVLLFCVTALPWGVAMYARHGQVFVDKLLFDHIVKRAFGHMHDTNEGDDVSFRYYVWQLGYATFPWTGLVPIALSRWARKGFGTAVVLGAWFLVGFALFAVMGTKFHHYCLPILPPAAMLTGRLLDDLMQRKPADGALLGAVAVGAALVTLLVGRDLTAADLGPMRLMHLFTYNYDRPWPKTLDFVPELWAFTLCAALLMVLLVVRRARRALTMGLVALSLAFATWGLDVYLTKLSPHWGQRELFVLYERARLAHPGQVIAYTMNWKGENFYRGNTVPAFKSTGHRFQRWIDEQKKLGEKTFYFVLQHTRVNTLKAELGEPEIEKLSDEALNNKFVLVRVSFE